MIRKIIQLHKIIRKDIRENILSQIFPLKPLTLNLFVNDVCNSHCNMCLIWKRNRDKEITPNELNIILKDPLFSKLKYVGVSGGEPTLREDIPKIFHVLSKKKPTLAGSGIITNGLNPRKSINEIKEAYKICQKSGIAFNAMVSLDGLDDVHDHIRGRVGSFNNAIEVILKIRESTKIPISFGCTISKDNVWNVDELLDFSKREKLYGRFRIAEFVNRLYNEKQTYFIRNFSSLESYHLGLFFFRLERDYEKNDIIKRTYRNIRSMLVDGGMRSIKCPNQSNAITLGCQGQLSYCAPKSKIIGNALHDSALDIYYQNIDERRRIIAEHCQSCIHDYHSTGTTKEYLKEIFDRFYKKRFNIRYAIQKSDTVIRKNKENGAKFNKIPNKALIVGWFGTETIGDKAILSEIVHQLRKKGYKKIFLASFYPFLTRWTLKELRLNEVKVIENYHSQLIEAAKKCDITIMGGGPLMDIPQLDSVLTAFYTAKESGNQTLIAGCGIGPLENPLYIKAVRMLINLSDVVHLRDSRSVEWAKKNTRNRNISKSGDYAIGFVKRWSKKKDDNHIKQPYLCCYFREWTDEYRGSLSVDAFQESKKIFEYQLSLIVKFISKKYSLRPRLIAMHNFFVGGDDRIFNRKFARKFLFELRPIVDIKPMSLNQILESMIDSKFCLTMRFHSTLFAQTLNIPFLAIDYTLGGKVYAFLKDLNALDKLIVPDEISNNKWKQKVILT